MVPGRARPGFRGDGGDRWSSPAYLVFAAAGTAAGLGPLWLFPSLVLEHGGGAFVLAYLAALLLVGLPLLIAELLLGRTGAPDPRRAFALATSWPAPAQASAAFLLLLTAALLLSSCGVFGGWALDFAWAGLSNKAPDAGHRLQDLLSDPLHTLLMQAAFFGLAAAIVARGLRAGIERALRWIMPALISMLVALVFFAMVTSDYIGQSLALLGRADFSRLGAAGLVAALGLALLTVAAGCGVMLGYGAHAGRELPLARTAIAIILLDAVVALLAALAILPVLLGTGVESAAGAALLFVTLPPAFAALAGGTLLAGVFYTSVALATLASCVSLFGPLTAALHGLVGLRRPAAAVVVAAGCWALGAAQGLAPGAWRELAPAALGLRGPVEVLPFGMLLPAGATLVALAVGWSLARRNTVRARS